MTNDTESLITEVREVYENSITGSSSRIDGGDRLWNQLEAAVKAVESGHVNGERQLRERINEVAMAKHLLDDETIDGSIAYEPDILPSGRRIDFVLERNDDAVFVEVKSVYPRVIHRR